MDEECSFGGIVRYMFSKIPFIGRMAHSSHGEMVSVEDGIELKTKDHLDVVSAEEHYHRNKISKATNGWNNDMRVSDRGEKKEMIVSPKARIPSREKIMDFDFDEFKTHRGAHSLKSSSKNHKPWKDDVVRVRERDEHSISAPTPLQSVYQQKQPFSNSNTTQSTELCSKSSIFGKVPYLQVCGYICSI